MEKQPKRVAYPILPASGSADVQHHQSQHLILSSLTEQEMIRWPSDQFVKLQPSMNPAAEPASAKQGAALL